MPQPSCCPTRAERMRPNSFSRRTIGQAFASTYRDFTGVMRNRARKILIGPAAGGRRHKAHGLCRRCRSNPGWREPARRAQHFAPGRLEDMANEVMDWDSAYRQEAGFDGPPPWNIGEPQPELAALAA